MISSKYVFFYYFNIFCNYFVFYFPLLKYFYYAYFREVTKSPILEKDKLKLRFYFTIIIIIYYNYCYLF